MNMMNRRQVLGSSAALLLSPLAVQAQQKWPSKPIKIVVAFAPGGSLDALARSTAKYLEETLKTTVLVENLSGAGGRIGTQAVARASGDGYTYLFTSSAAHGVAPALYSTKELGYDPLNQFSHISLACSGPIALMVKADAPYKTLNELIAYVKESSQPLFYGSGAMGGLGHLTGALIGLHTKMPTQHVSYRGSAPALQDMLAGNLMSVSDNLASHMGQYRSGNIRILGIAAKERMSSLPEIPTFAEQGFPEIQAAAWYGLSGSGGIPPEIQNKMNAAMAEFLAREETQKNILATGMLPEGKMSAEQYSKFVAGEISKWSEVIKSANISIS